MHLKDFTMPQIVSQRRFRVKVRGNKACRREHEQLLSAETEKEVMMCRCVDIFFGL